MEIKKFYLLDTSVILDDPNNILHIYQEGNNDVVITDIVLSELDNLKDGNNEKAFLSREFFRLINTDNGEAIREPVFGKPIFEGDFVRKLSLNFPGLVIPIYIVNRHKYKDPYDKNDNKISEIAYDYGMKLLTNDVSFKIRALSKHIDVDSLKKDSLNNPLEIEFLKSFNVSSSFESSEINTNEEFLKLPNWTMIELDETLKDNEEIKSGKRHYGLKIDGKYEDIDIDTLVEKTQPYIPPVNLEQKLFFSMMIHNRNQITVASGSTGSGKTLIALQAGLHLVKKGVVDGIVYLRNTVTSADKEAELGFRKGDQTQKLNYFMYPLYAAVNFTIEKLRTSSWVDMAEYSGDVNKMTRENATEKFLINHNIEMVDIAHARGTTITRKFVIFDETQNASNATVKLIGTRIGKESKIVFLGDWSQIDHPYLSKQRNGLITLLTKASKDNFIAGIHLKHTIRSEVAEWFDREFS